MSIELMRINAGVYGVGAVLTEATFQYLSSHGRFHSRRMIFPVLPNDELFHISELGVISAAVQFVHLRITSIGTAQVPFLCDGEFDCLLTNSRLEQVLGEELPRMATEAVITCPPLRYQMSFVSWVELWEVEGDRARFLKRVTTFEGL